MTQVAQFFLTFHYHSHPHSWTFWFSGVPSGFSNCLWIVCDIFEMVESLLIASESSFIPYSNEAKFFKGSWILFDSTLFAFRYEGHPSGHCECFTSDIDRSTIYYEHNYVKKQLSTTRGLVLQGMKHVNPKISKLILLPFAIGICNIASSNEFYEGIDVHKLSFITYHKDMFINIA